MKPLFLITNDDGIGSPGLLALAETALAFGEVLVAAPSRQQTGMGRSFPRVKNLGRIEETTLRLESGATLTGYGVTGSPAYTVAHAILELAPRKPTFCLSGVNYGENLGTNITCSGTVGAVLEASTHGVPGLAFSVQAELDIQHSREYPPLNWGPAKEAAAFWLEKVLAQGLPEGAEILNINLPKAQANPGAWRYTRQSRQSHFEFIPPPGRNWDEPYELSSQTFAHPECLEPDSDIYAVWVDRLISVTPLAHDLTAPGWPQAFC